MQPPSSLDVLISAEHFAQTAIQSSQGTDRGSSPISRRMSIVRYSTGCKRVIEFPRCSRYRSESCNTRAVHDASRAVPVSVPSGLGKHRVLRFLLCQASGGPCRAAGPPKNGSGWKAVHWERVDAFGGRRYEQIMTSG
eukprot:7888391-Pyramimonas_sp.AAC.1